MTDYPLGPKARRALKQARPHPLHLRARERESVKERACVCERESVCERERVSVCDRERALMTPLAARCPLAPVIYVVFVCERERVCVCERERERVVEGRGCRVEA